ncbi:DUF7432 family protein [Prescottella agglutinans]|uniref:Uncharacterized protein n=1 Tax=Prescottella agglutinans TaxID=1644129 RepID=A0ABT6M7U0_9NOCA|nr:hypothetical protein [Prescottella agglutinans]MDH6279504.1 hypothetical protein [Prescottella agglutinans]
MSRPETIDDLDEYTRRGNQAAIGTVGEFDNQPDMIAAWGQFLQAARDAGYAIADNGHVYRTPTYDELKRDLTYRQEAWDRTAAEYEAALDGADEPKYPYALKEWCRKEGHDYPYTEETR